MYSWRSLRDSWDPSNDAQKSLIRLWSRCLQSSHFIASILSRASFKSDFSSYFGQGSSHGSLKETWPRFLLPSPSLPLSLSLSLLPLLLQCRFIKFFRILAVSQTTPTSKTPTEAVIEAILSHIQFSDRELPSLYFIIIVIAIIFRDGFLLVWILQRFSELHQPAR